MADVFISYSRRDAAFVHRLNSGLTDHGLDVYVDFEDVPSWSPDYEDELFRAIEGSDTFLFVITPDSITSPNCRIELEHASAQGKRIRPLLLRQPDPGLIPEPLRRPQWTSFAGDRSFEEDVTELVEVLKTDPEWVQAHTRLVTRATEWERRRHDKSLLLRGSDLEAAEEWLAQQAGKSPPPTRLQSDLLLASRRQATRRQRIVLLSVVVALAITGVLAAVALLERDHAQAERDRAVLRGDIARSRELAALSLSQLETDPQRGLRAAVKADGAFHTTQARDALVQSLLSAHLRAVLRGGPYDSSFHAASFTPDGRYVVAASAAGYALVWRRKSGKLVARLKVDSRPDLCCDDVVDLAISPDGRFLAAAGFEKAVQIRQLNTKAIVSTLPIRAEGFATVAFAPSSSSVLTTDRTDKARLRSVHGRLIREFRQKARIIADATFSRGGSRILTATTDGRVDIWDVRAARVVRELRGGSHSTVGAFSPDGRVVATGSDDGVLRLWRLRDSRIVDVLRGHGGAITAVDYSADGQLIVTSSLDDTARLWSARSGRLVATLAAHQEDVNDARFSPDGKWIVTAGGDGRVLLWTVAAGESRTLRGPTGTVWSAIFDRHGKHVLIATEDGVRLRDASSGRSLAVFQGHTRRVNTVALSPDNRRVVTASDDGTARVWDAASARELVALRPGGRVKSASFSGDGNYLFTIGRNFQAWDTRTWRKVLDEDCCSGGGTVVPAPEGRGWMSVDEFGVEYQWTGADGTSEGQLSEASATGGTFSRDGSLFISWSDDGTAHLWSWAAITTGNGARARAGRGTLHGHGGAITSAAFTPSNRFVATGGADGTVIIWDVAKRTAVGSIDTPTAPVRTVQFSPSGETILVGGHEGGVTFYICLPCLSLRELVSLAHRRILR